MNRFNALAVALLAAGCAAAAPAAPPVCNSGCLLGMVETYLEAMLAHDASRLPLAANLQATENGRPFRPGEGLWKTAQTIPYRHTVVDPRTGQAVFFGVVAEPEGEAIFVVRLAVRARQISEVETLVARKGAHGLFQPAAVRQVKGIWNMPVPAAEGSPRARMLEIVDSYFEGIEKHTAAAIPFHPDCIRTENGVQTTNNPDQSGLAASCAASIPAVSYIEKVRARRYPLVDEAHGVVLAIVHFDIPAQRNPNGGTTSRTLFLFELFKIESGRIREIEAFMANQPLGASLGWERSQPAR